MVQTLTGLDHFEEHVLRVPSHKVVIVDCAWTRPPHLKNVPNNRISEFFAPKFDAIAQKYDGDDTVAFYRVQILQSPWIAQQPYLISTPNIIFFKGGVFREASTMKTNWEDTSELEKLIVAYVEETYHKRDTTHGKQ